MMKVRRSCRSLSDCKDAFEQCDHILASTGSSGDDMMLLIGHIRLVDRLQSHTEGQTLEGRLTHSVKPISKMYVMTRSMSEASLCQLGGWLEL